MSQPPNEPPEVPPCAPPEGTPKKRGTRNLNRGVPKNVERGPDGKLRPRAPAEPALSEDTETRLEAMRHVERTGPGSDRTYQQRNQRILLTKNPVAFHDRLAELEREERKNSEKPPSIEPNDSKPTWDGVGPCPCCGWTKEKALEDDGANKVMKLLAELRDKERGDAA